MTPSRWQSYDAVAESYEHVWHPAFEPVARDLVALAEVAPRARVLDAGTGTGVVAAEAAAQAGAGLVVGIDPSVAMLKRARVRAPASRPVAGETPGLPFPARVFDTVLASLVVSHFAWYDVALADLVRVLRPGGRLGVTVWGSIQDEPVDDGHQRQFVGIWRSVAERFVDVDADEIDAAIPWEGWFGDPARLRGALESSGLRSVEIHGRTYRRDVSRHDMLLGTETSLRGRYVRDALDDESWNRFGREVAEAVAATLPDPMTRVDELLVGVGTKEFDTRS